MKESKEMRCDSLTLFLSCACNTDQTMTERARRIRKCAKIICARTNDKEFKQALRTIRNDNRDYLVVKAVNVAIVNYLGKIA